MVKTSGQAQEREATRHPRRRLFKRVIAAVLVLALVALAIAYAAFLRDMTAARARIARIPSRTCSSKSGTIEYLLVGQGPTVLISHGVTGGIDQGMALTNEFGSFGTGYRFLYVSRFGYLKSSMPSHPCARLQAAAYKELLDHLGIDKVFVFGNSAGGPSTMWFAVDYPQRTKGVILQSSVVPGAKVASTPPLVFENNFVYWLAIKAMPGMLTSIFEPKSLSLTPREEDFVIENLFQAALPISERSAGILFDNQVSTPSVAEIPFEKIEVPTLILHAVDDPAPPIDGAREITRRIPKSRLVELGGGHLLLRHEMEVRRENSAFVAENN